MSAEMGPTTSRRTLAKGALWTAPAIVTAAPAAMAAASTPCSASSAVTVKWVSSTGETLNANSGATATGSDGTSAVSVSSNSTSTRFKNMVRTTVSNGVQYSGDQWIQLYQQGPKSNPGSQTVTITLPTNAYCVTFYVNDIDAQGDSGQSYVDKISVPGFTATTNSAYVSASGSVATSTTSAPTSTSAEWDNTTSANGLAKFTSPAGTAVKTISLTYTNTYPTGTNVSSNQQQVYISPISYYTDACNCAA